MGESATVKKGLSVPHVEDVLYERNFLKSVVCELKFPTLLEMETQQPVAIRNALKKEYPHYEMIRSVAVRPVGIVDEKVPQMLSMDKRWSLTVRPYALNLETSQYRSFEELLKQVEQIVSKCLPHLDTDFFTRVGLRYINHFPVKVDQASKWFHRSLVAALETGEFGEVDSCFQEIRGTSTHGKFLLRHGYLPTEQPQTEYLVDTDFYVEPLEATHVVATLKALHEETYDLFYWALAEYGRSQLGQPRTKPKGGGR